LREVYNLPLFLSVIRGKELSRKPVSKRNLFDTSFCPAA
jgi:hypothetical protein